MGIPKKPKDSASMSKVAKTYRKTTKPATDYNEGSRYFNTAAKSTYLGGTSRKNTYKPAPKRGVFGSDSPSGGYTTVRKAVKATKKK